MRVQPMTTLREALKRRIGYDQSKDETVDDILRTVVYAMEAETKQFRSYDWKTLIEWVRKQ